MMRKLAVALALASTVLASPSLARDKSWYVGVEGGAMIVEDIEFDVGEASKATVVDRITVTMSMVRSVTISARSALKPKSAIGRSEEHTSELQSLMRISYAVLCLNNTKQH